MFSLREMESKVPADVAFEFGVLASGRQHVQQINRYAQQPTPEGAVGAMSGL